MNAEELRTLRILKAIPTGMSMMSANILRIDEEVLRAFIQRGIAIIQQVDFGDRHGPACFLTEEGRALAEAMASQRPALHLVPREDEDNEAART
jgi:hypothetical protein